MASVRRAIVLAAVLCRARARVDGAGSSRRAEARLGLCRAGVVHNGVCCPATCAVCAKRGCSEAGLCCRSTARRACERADDVACLVHAPGGPRDAGRPAMPTTFDPRWSPGGSRPRDPSRHRAGGAAAPPDALAANETVRLLDELLAAGRVAAAFRAARETYFATPPFPHAVVDGLFPLPVLEAVMGEIPEAETCQTRALRYRKTKCYAQKGVQHLKHGLEDETAMGPHTRALFRFLKSDGWLRELEKLTGFGDAARPSRGRLVTDPGNQGAGVHVTAPGGQLKVHSDFNGFAGMARRVNAFVYLNHEWPEGHGGHLQLWDRNMTSCVQNVAPVLNRFVVFECDDWSFHGHPDPLAAPAGRARRSIAQYYYTEDEFRPPGECRQCDRAPAADGRCACYKHSTLWQDASCGACADPACKRGGAPR